MSTKIDIYNKTLIKLGSETITDLNIDTKPVRLMNTIYDNVKNEELQKNNWIFAKRRRTLVACDIVETLINISKVEIVGFEFSIYNNVLMVTAAQVGEEYNNVKISCSSDKVKCATKTLVGGDEHNKAHGEFIFLDNLNIGDTFYIGNYILVAGMEFDIGKTEVGKFARKFLLPKDLLLLLEIEGFGALATYMYQYGARTNYDLYDNIIVCNNPIITINYTAYVDDARLDVNFINVLSCRLAMELCEVLCQSDNKSKFFIDKYILAVREAKRVNAIQMPNASCGTGILERSRL